MGILFGTEQKYTFDGPAVLSTAQLPSKHGIYSIVVKAPSGNYRVLYIGQTSDFSQRGFPDNHHAYNRWVAYVGNKNDLLIALLLTTGLSDDKRCEIEKYLISCHDPPCNKTE
ncbi:MAG: GIY-YIG nuclease family protein [Sphaerochaetaceae bacterium]|nr:GIY-YIG nuclease family protein [Sphaerochaetaceae bacterium]